MTRVGFLGPVPPIRGGIAAHSAGILRAMTSAGYEPTVVSWQRQYPGLLYRRPERADDCRPYPNVDWTMRWWDPTSWWRAGRTLRGSEMVVVPWTVPVHAPHYLAALRAASAPYAVHVHNVEPHEPIPGAIVAARRLFGEAERLVTHAESLAERCRVLAPKTPVSVVPMPPLLPVDTRSLPPTNGPIRLLALGYLRDYKGTDIAMAAVRSLRDAGHDVELTIAGEPWDGNADKWHRLVRDLGLCGHVRLDLRYVPDSDVPRLISNHHLFVAPYRTATQSGIVAQALAAGRPVVATRTGGLPDMVHDDANGALAKPGDVDSFAAAVQRTLPALSRLSDGARARSGSFADVAGALVGRAAVGEAS